MCVEKTDQWPTRPSQIVDTFVLIMKFEIAMNLWKEMMQSVTLNERTNCSTGAAIVDKGTLCPFLPCASNSMFTFASHTLFVD